MFSKHVSKNLSAYCNGELESDETRIVAEHLIACNRCREQYEEIKLGVSLAGHIPELTAPNSLWQNIENHLADSKPSGASTRADFFSFTVWQRALASSLAAILLATAVALVWSYSREVGPSWQVARLAGAPTIGANRIDGNGRLAVGQWLETDGSSRAKIDVSSIGQVEVDPNTRIRLVETKPTEHRIELAQGKMTARIWAPPRLFFVDTAAAVAADLGCAYTLEVDDHGDGLLHVTSGWVALQLKDRESMVPAGASCATRPGVGPGTPYFSDASEKFQRELTRLDFEPRSNNVLVYATSLGMLMVEARPRDTLSLWHLLFRVEGRDRELVYERMATLAPPPEGVTRQGVLQLNEPMLQIWKDKLAEIWTESSGAGGRQKLDKPKAQRFGVR
ncbi:MAG TPA: zf-HC2 domain-containing protein [Pyrinomonadaceae bacterium]|nr:zf-HC2 domain-containing protein [Pyrinomonadaceae bacterium]